jgi:hypothetical protein
VRKSEREESGPIRHGRNARQHKAIVLEATTYLSCGAAAARVFSVMVTATTTILACPCIEQREKNRIKRKNKRFLNREKKQSTLLCRTKRKRRRKINFLLFFLSTWKKEVVCSLFSSFLLILLPVSSNATTSKRI